MGNLSSSGRAKVIVLPGNNLAIDGCRDDFLFLGVFIGAVLLMFVKVDMVRATLMGSDITSLDSSRVIDSKLLQADGASEVNRDL